MVTLLRRPQPATNSDGIVASAKRHLATQQAMLKDDPLTERPGLDTLHAYVHGLQAHPSVPRIGGTVEVRDIARRSRVNILELIVSSVAQSMYVDGYRAAIRRGANAAEDAADPDRDAPAWDIWQANKMDAGQIAIHRSALTYGWCYVTVMPGEPVPVIKGWSPRRLIAMYGDDPDWPLSAMSIEPSGDHIRLRLYDQTRIWNLSAKDMDGGAMELDDWVEHDVGKVPVVRFQNVGDLDEDYQGEIEGLLPIQDQINDTTFELRVAQKYGAFKQKYILGWTTTEEEARIKASASQLWVFDDPEVKVGEFNETNLSGYIDSREASLRHAAALSQTPAHELIGQLVNLSAEALVAAEASQRRKVTERQKSFGESHEQMLALAAEIDHHRASVGAQVRWADTESRAFAATVDGLAKLAALGVPIQLILERVPGLTQEDVKRGLAILDASPPPAPPAAPAPPAPAGGVPFTE